VMVLCDVARAVLVGAMAIPGMPLAALVPLLFVVTTLQSPFQAARTAIVADVLAGDGYVLGVAVTRLTNQTGYVIGFAVGGTVVAFLGAPTALAVDAGTFVASAALVWLGVRRRAAAAGQLRESTWGAVRTGARL